MCGLRTLTSVTIMNLSQSKTLTRPAPHYSEVAIDKPSRLSKLILRLKRHDNAAAAVIALPGIAIFGYFAWWPIVRGAIMSFQHTNLVAAASWVGVENFSYVLTDPLLPTAVLNTAWFAFLGIVLGFPLPLFLAVLIAETKRGKQFFSALIYLPAVVPPAVAILLWQFFYGPSASGTFNTVLGWAGIAPQPWLNSSATAMISIVIEVIWATAGSTAIIYVAAIAQVRSELYEAAELDGCGIWARIWHITLPQLRDVILVLLLLQIIGTLQVFTEPFLFTGGGPNNATTTVLMSIYNYAFVKGDYGAATALSVMLALALGIFSAGYSVLTRRWAK
jgi:multiple sugar transport system permease protein